jgi:hypothetical protein
MNNNHLPVKPFRTFKTALVLPGRATMQANPDIPINKKGEPKSHLNNL